MSKQINLTRKLSLNNHDKKPSVFERLGIKSEVVFQGNICQYWAENGTCPYEKHCKFSQSHTVSDASKRLKSDTMKKANIAHKKCKDLHKKTIHSHHGSDMEWEGWELADLEEADEKVLEKRKQELQRELQLQLKKEKELIKKKEKKINKKRAPSTSSSSATTDSSSSTSSTSSSSSDPPKRSNRKRKHSSSSSESAQGSHRQKKKIKTLKTKSSVLKKQVEKKIFRQTEDMKSKSNASKKTTTRKKSYSPDWEKSRDRSQSKPQNLKKSPHCLPNTDIKKKSASPHYNKIIIKNKGRGYSPKNKSNEPSPKKGVKKTKDSSIYGKDKIRAPSRKLLNSPSKIRKISPLIKSRRRDDSMEKRRGHHEDPKYVLKKDHSREKDKKKEFTRGRSSDNDNNGGLKKGGKILPLKPPNYNKLEGNKKETNRSKSSDKNLFDSKIKENSEKNRERQDREKDKPEKEKNKCERDKNKRKKNGDEYEKRSVREKDTVKNIFRNRDERCRERENERSRLIKEKDLERQKEREMGSDRSREKLKERDRMDKEKKEKEDKKHFREIADVKENRERELFSFLEIKSEISNKITADINHLKSSEKHLPRESHRNTDKSNEKSLLQEKNGRERCSSSDKDHDRRDLLARKQGVGDRDPDSKKSRDNGESRNAAAETRRNFGEGRRGVEENGRQWEELWRAPLDVFHDKKKTLDANNGDRRQHMTNRRLQEDSYRRHSRNESDADIRDFATIDERRNGSRKLISERFEWSTKDENNDYRSAETSDEWKNRSERHYDWNCRYDQKWMNREESHDESWSHYSRRGPKESWANDWLQDSSRQIYTESERCQSLIEGGFSSDLNGKRRNGSEIPISTENGKNNETNVQELVPGCGLKSEKSLKEEKDALSDISDDPDDILNRDDYSGEDIPPDQFSHNTNSQIFAKNNEYYFEQRKRPLFECLGERSLDFEEISDEELEEEARAGKGMVDVLGADWAGLLRETCPTTKIDNIGSAHFRWTTEKLISTIGISFKYAGNTFVHAFVDERNWVYKCNVSVPKQESEKEVQGLKEITNEEKIQFDNTELKINEFLKDYKSKEKLGAFAKMFHIVPGLHSILKEDRCMKSIMFSSHNRFKRGLSARTDLALRRKLCNLPSKEPLHFTPPLDKKMFETSIQQFHNGQTTAAV